MVMIGVIKRANTEATLVMRKVWDAYLHEQLWLIIEICSIVDHIKYFPMIDNHLGDPLLN